MILDSQGRVLVQSDGLSPSDPDSVIDQYLAAGNYSLVVESTGGAGTYALTTTLAPASAPLSAHPGGVWADRDRGGRLHRRRPTPTWPLQTAADRHRVGAAGQRRRHLPAPGHLRGGVRSRSRSWRATSPATAASTWPSQTRDVTDTGCRCCWATATARSSPRSPTRWGRSPTRSWRATSPATAAPTSPSQTATVNDRVGAAGQRRRHLPAPGRPTRWDRPGSDRGGRLHRRRPHRPGRRKRRRQHRVGAAGQRRRHVPAPGHLRGGDVPTRSWRATSPATAAPTSPSPNDNASDGESRCCWATATARSSPRSPTRWG